MTPRDVVLCPGCHASQRGDALVRERCGASLLDHVHIVGSVRERETELHVKLPLQLTERLAGTEDVLSATRLVREAIEFLRTQRFPRLVQERDEGKQDPK